MISRHSEILRVRHAPDDIFELVSDVERYPEFIRYITSLRTRDVERDDDISTCNAEAIVRFRFARERFVTKVTADKRDMRVQAELIEGPFNTLHNVWQLAHLEDGSTRIAFRLDFEFNSVMLDMLVRAHRHRAVKTMIALYGKEAARRYSQVGEKEFSGLETLHSS